MDKLTFYRGVLCALRTKREEFLAEGDRFHQAFGATVQYARKNCPEPALSPPPFHLDPIFGVYPEANEMLLEGEQDFLISLLNPRHQKAMFRISRDEAMEELQSLPNHEWFLTLGDLFDHELGG